MNASADWLPDLVLLKDYGGDWSRYVEALFGFFYQDFVASRPVFEGRRVGHKKHPMHKGKEAGFWHLVSGGEIEEDRLPDLRRCERIRWPGPMIKAAATGRVKCWRNRRGTDERIVVATEDFSYVVILADRGEYVLLWTAYYVEKNHRRRKLEKEFKAKQIAPK